MELTSFDNVFAYDQRICAHAYFVQFVRKDLEMMRNYRQLYFCVMPFCEKEHKGTCCNVTRNKCQNVHNGKVHNVTFATMDWSCIWNDLEGYISTMSVFDIYFKCVCFADKVYMIGKTKPHLASRVTQWIIQLYYIRIWI